MKFVLFDFEVFKYDWLVVFKYPADHNYKVIINDEDDDYNEENPIDQKQCGFRIDIYSDIERYFKWNESLSY